MKKIKIFAAAIIAVLFLSGCTAEDTVPPSETDAASQTDQESVQEDAFQETDEETETWISRVTELMGSEPVYDGESSEGGSQNWKWIADGFSASIYRMKDILTLYLQPAVGELN